MNLKEHPTDKSLREYLIGSLRPESEGEVSLHLSFCPTCQESLDAVLLDIAFTGREQQSESAGGHFGDKELREFWADTAQDPHRVEEMSRHFLQCRPCRDRRHQLRRELRKTAARTFIGVALVIGFVALARRYRRIAWSVIAILGVGVVALIFTNRKDLAQPPGSQLTIRYEVAAPNLRPSPLPTVEPVVPASPPDIPPKRTQPRKNTDRPAVVKATRPTRRMEPSGATQEELAQYQNVNLRNDPESIYFRGADEDDSQVKVRHKVVIARRGRTRLNISLPEAGRSGLYFVYVQEPAHLATMTEGKGFSADGARLSISIDMHRLLPGEYVLCITRRNEQTGTEEYLGHFPLQAISPAAKALSKGR